MYFGRSPAPGAGNETELWNGSSWTEIADMTIPGWNAGSAGNAGSTSSILMAGQSPGTFNQTEVWDGAPAVVKTVTVS